jgi:hypothetical protein
MRRRPSPSLILSIIAIVLALGGTSVAAITFVRNAGAVDGISAVSWRSSTKHAANKLVSASTNGKIPQRFVDTSGLLNAYKSTFHQALQVNDNQAGAPVTIGGFPGVGTLSAQCDDQNAKTGVEDPQMKITFANTSPGALDLSRFVGNGNSTVISLAQGAQDAFTINNANSFSELVNVNGTELQLVGAVRQDGAGTATGICSMWGYTLVVPA